MLTLDSESGSKNNEDLPTVASLSEILPGSLASLALRPIHTSIPRVRSKSVHKSPQQNHRKLLSAAPLPSIAAKSLPFSSNRKTTAPLCLSATSVACANSNFFMIVVGAYDELSHGKNHSQFRSNVGEISLIKLEDDRLMQQFRQCVGGRIYPSAAAKGLSA